MDGVIQLYDETMATAEAENLVKNATHTHGHTANFRQDSRARRVHRLPFAKDALPSSPVSKESEFLFLAGEANLDTIRIRQTTKQEHIHIQFDTSLLSCMKRDRHRCRYSMYACNGGQTNGLPTVRTNIERIKFLITKVIPLSTLECQQSISNTITSSMHHHMLSKMSVAGTRFCILVVVCESITAKLLT